MRRIFLKLLLLTALLGGLIFNPLSTKALAQQQYEPCDSANPNYCTECRDESKRDFAKCGEIDYNKHNLGEFDAAGRLIKWPDSTMDYDHYNEKAVLSLNIGTDDNPKVDIFIAEGTNKIVEGGLSYTLHPKKFKRVTYSENKKKVFIYPFWTASREIAYKEFIQTKEGAILIPYVIDREGNNSKKISREEYSRRFRESHKSNFANPNPANLMIDVPPSN